MPDNTMENAKTYSTGELPAENVPDMEDIMQKKPSWRESELAPMYWAFIAVGVPIDIVEVGTIAWWIATGDWRPFAIALPLIVAACAFIARAYRKRTAYVCPHCGEVFVPEGAEWFFATHTPTTRRLSCSCCGTKDWCAEVSRDRLGSKKAA